ncbi:Cas10/Cmr2 second palm domain-containing protein [Aliarcobacter butzleri]|uniref:Cas10/Cmr2 second palm domain-containing protein n=1 Tax=Aliarcobacter butzleri TaxID=28197 RepID=UPI003B227378
MNYIALTIGPIHEVLINSKKTRELWVGSYFFSYFMKSLISKLLESEEKIDFLVPFVKDNELDSLNISLEVGVFHDRFIATSTSSKENLKNFLENKISETLFDFAEIISKNEKDKYYNALKEYFQYHYIIATENELLENTKKENIVFSADAILDSLELQTKFTFDNKTNIANSKDVQTKDKINPIAKLQYEASRLKKDLELNKLNFLSIPEIALANIIDTKIFKNFDFIKFKDEDNLNEYDFFYKAFENEKTFKPYHKYFAVIQADGDKMGENIRKNLKNIGEISKNIYKYITQEKGDFKSINKMFEDFGGMLIYAGGDDLLGFAPIVGKDGKSFFKLLENLSSKFKNYLGNDLSLSFGVSINYYKSPMIEAINQSSYLLFDKAKNHNTDNKSGSVALSLTKHSGQTFEGTFFLNDNIYKSYEKLFEDELSEKIELPHNIQYSLKSLETIFISIFKNNENIDERVNAIFKNLVQDSSQNEKMKSSIDEIKNYLLKVKPSTKVDFEKFITQLAIIKFLRGDM